jgi:hypothetical protein
MGDRGIICESDLGEAAMLFAALQQGQHFSARDYSEFAKIGAVALEDEQANEVLLGLVERKHLREIGPGVYAAVPVGGASIEAQGYACPKCMTVYPPPAPQECDFCGVSLALRAVQLEEPLWPEEAPK